MKFHFFFNDDGGDDEEDKPMMLMVMISQFFEISIFSMMMVVMMRKMMMMMMIMLKHSMVTEPVIDWQTNIKSITKRCIREVSTRIIKNNGHTPLGPHLDFFVCFRKDLGRVWPSALHMI